MLLCMTVSTIYNVNERVPMSGLVAVSMLLPPHFSHFWAARICGTRAIQHRNIQEAFQNLDRNLDKLPGNNQGISSNHWCQPWPLAGLLQKKLIFHNSLVTSLERCWLFFIVVIVFRLSPATVEHDFPGVYCREFILFLLVSQTKLCSFCHDDYQVAVLSVVE